MYKSLFISFSCLGTDYNILLWSYFSKHTVDIIALKWEIQRRSEIDNIHLVHRDLISRDLGNYLIFISIAVCGGHPVRAAAPGPHQGGLPGLGDSEHLAVGAGRHGARGAAPPAPGPRGFSLRQRLRRSRPVQPRWGGRHHRHHAGADILMVSPLHTGQGIYSNLIHSDLQSKPIKP